MIHSSIIPLSAFLRGLTPSENLTQRKRFSVFAQKLIWSIFENGNEFRRLKYAHVIPLVYYKVIQLTDTINQVYNVPK